MDESKDKERWCDTVGVCALDSEGNYRYGSYAKALHAICQGVRGGGASLCTRTEVQTDRGREKLVTEKESHIETIGDVLNAMKDSVSLSVHTHTHTRAKCPYCKWGDLVQDVGLVRLQCENCMSDFYLEDGDL